MSPWMPDFFAWPCTRPDADLDGVGVRVLAAVTEALAVGLQGAEVQRAQETIDLRPADRWSPPRRVWLRAVGRGRC